MPSRVFVEHCSDYRRDLVEAGVRRLFARLGGLESWVGTNTTVLLKVNLLSPKEPARAATTHPVLAWAVAKCLKEAGARVQIGDSSGGVFPGGERTEESFAVCGMTEIAQELGVETVNFDRAEAVSLPNPRGSSFGSIVLAKPVLQADLVIDMPKLKTHSLTVFTGAVKNMYGCVPGNRKMWYHKEAPGLERFSDYILDIFSAAAPGLTIMDGITGMEGDGPAAGTPRHIGALLAGTDGVAVDAVACRLVGIPTQALAVFAKAKARQLGDYSEDVVEVQGPAAALKLKDFRFRRQPLPLPGFAARAGISLLSAPPVIDRQRCVDCGICRRACPVEAIEVVRGHHVIAARRCVQCYCCHELCPHAAVELHSSWLRSVLQRLYETFKH